MTIDTTKGPMDAARLERRVIVKDGRTQIEYYDGPELVHRSVVVALTGTTAAGTAKGA